MHYQYPILSLRFGFLEIHWIKRIKFIIPKIQKWGFTGNRTRIKGFKVPYANHYTIKPPIILINVSIYRLLKLALIDRIKVLDEFFILWGLNFLSRRGWIFDSLKLGRREMLHVLSKRVSNGLFGYFAFKNDSLVGQRGIGLRIINSDNLVIIGIHADLLNVGKRLSLELLYNTGNVFVVTLGFIWGFFDDSLGSTSSSSIDGSESLGEFLSIL